MTLSNLRAGLLVAASVALTACASSGSPPEESEPILALQNQCPETPACDAAITVAPDSPALLLKDPEVLAELPLDKVLGRVLELHGDTQTTPEELLQRVFDTNNNSAGAVFEDGVHCDSDDNRAHANGPAAFCPRSEGALALKPGLLDPDQPDGFVPVAVVNRIDRMGGEADCGETRVVYAKTSGTNNPDDRVFLILEAALTNPFTGCLNMCRDVATFWRDMETRTPAERAEAIHRLMFEGLPFFKPALHPIHLGLPDDGGTSSSGYFDSRGQLRVSQHMDEHWEYRELQLRETEEGLLRFVPVTVKNNPLPSRFAPDNAEYDNYTFQYYFPADAWTLAAPTLERIGMTIDDRDDAGESVLGGPRTNDYAQYVNAGGNEDFNYFIQVDVGESPVVATCPPDDPLDVRAVMRRATTQSCAGCHAPSELLGPDRKIGCGLVWPDSLGQVHIDEKGNLSPALKELFLPHRARLLSTFLRSCDEDSIRRDLHGGRIGPDGAPPYH